MKISKKKMDSDDNKKQEPEEIAVAEQCLKSTTERFHFNHQKVFASL